MTEKRFDICVGTFRVDSRLPFRHYSLAFLRCRVNKDIVTTFGPEKLSNRMREDVSSLIYSSLETLMFFRVPKPTVFNYLTPIG